MFWQKHQSEKIHFARFRRCLPGTPNTCKAKKIQQILNLLNKQGQKTHTKKKESADELMRRLTGIDITLCSKCKTGRLYTIKILPNFKQRQDNNYWDTTTWLRVFICTQYQQRIDLKRAFVLVKT